MPRVRELKRLHNSAVRCLLTAEALEVSDMVETGRAPTRNELFRKAWEGVAFANHHDFVTGTSPDRVYEAEQAPVLNSAQAAASDLLSTWAPPRPLRPGRSFGLHQDHGRVVVEMEHFRIVVNGNRGGTVTELENGAGPLLTGPAFDLVLWRDWGGLWRLGHEFLGGRFEPFTTSAAGRARIDVIHREGRLELRTTVTLRGAHFERRYEICPDTGYVGVSVRGRAPLGTSVTCAVPLNSRAQSLFMDVPGGAVHRPAVKVDRPTFWPARSLTCVGVQGQTAHLVLGGPAAVGLTEPAGWSGLSVETHPASGRSRRFPFRPTRRRERNAGHRGCSRRSVSGPFREPRLTGRRRRAGF